MTGELINGVVIEKAVPQVQLSLIRKYIYIFLSFRPIIIHFVD